MYFEFRRACCFFRVYPSPRVNSECTEFYTELDNRYVPASMLLHYNTLSAMRISAFPFYQGKTHNGKQHECTMGNQCCRFFSTLASVGHVLCRNTLWCFQISLETCTPETCNPHTEDSRPHARTQIKVPST